MNSPLDRNQNSTGWFSLGLGWLAIVIGIVGMFAPRKLARAIGIRERPLLFRLFGLRQIISGAGILTSPRKGNWFWSRVGGGAMDLALLGAALTAPRANRTRLSVAAGAIAGTALADTLGALTSKPGNSIHAAKSITVNLPPEELYAALRNLGNWPQFMTGLESVNMMDENRFRIVTKTLSGTRVESIAKITEDRPDKIRLSSFGTASADLAATVQLTPAVGKRGTVICVHVEYLSRSRDIGKSSKLLAKALEKRIDTDLHRFEQWVETGTVISTKGQSSGRSRRASTIYAETVGR